MFLTREPSSPAVEPLITSLLTSCSDLYFSYSHLSADNLTLLLSVLNEFTTKFTELFSNSVGFESMPLLQLIIHDNTQPSVCIEACKLLKNVISISPEMVREFDFPVLMANFQVLLQLHPRHIALTSQVILTITNYIANRRNLVPDLADPNHDLFLFCTEALQDDTCPIELQFGLCPFIALIAFSLQKEQLKFIARLLMKCINRAKEDKLEFPDHLIAAIVSITFVYPHDKLVNAVPVDFQESVSSSLTYSEYLELLGLSISHNSTNPTIALQAISTLSSVLQRNKRLKYPVTLLTGLRKSLVYFQRLGDRDAILFILKLLYGMDKDDVQQAEAMAESEIASGLTEVSFIHLI